MKKTSLKRGTLIRRRYLILIFAAMALLMISSATIELHQSRQELVDLMEKDAHSLSETVILASRKMITAQHLFEQLIEERLLNNAGLILRLYRQGRVTNRLLAELARQNNLYRINIFNSRGRKILYSHEPEFPENQGGEFRSPEILQPIFQGKADTLIIGLRQARHRAGFRYAVALATPERGAIVVNMDAEQLLEWRREIGFGSLLRRLVDNPGIIYAALQDTSGILAASGNVRQLERILDSPFLSRALRDSLFLARFTQFDSLQVLETVHPFYYQGEAIGLFRLGLSTEALHAINRRIYRRIVIISIVLILVGVLLFTLLMVRQNLEVIHRQYTVVETYSRNILENVSDAIIVAEEQNGIQIFNHAAEKLFGLSARKVVGTDIRSLLQQFRCSPEMSGRERMQEVECEVQGNRRYLLVSRSELLTPGHPGLEILVIRDLTRLKQMEAQIQRRERLTAMGQLASGVAHEIRNPLNAISTIIQQLNRDFVPQDNQEEYHQLTTIVYQEVQRINRTIENFLRFARPEPMQLEKFSLPEFFQRLHRQYQPILQEKGIHLRLQMDWHGQVRWDREKMQQVFMNLMQNAIDVLEKDGEIRIQVSGGDSGTVVVRFQDNGPGIPPEVQSRIFNLYFTTKPQGTGVGLAIVQRIVDEHGGWIHLQSEPGKGTVFVITIPVNAEETQ